MKQDVYIINAKRTPVGKFGKSLLEFPATELATMVIKNLLKKHLDIAECIDEVILGNVLSAGLGQNPARIASWKSGIPQNVPSFTINKVCGSGLKSIILATQAIQIGDANLIVAGGMENMSRAPFIIEKNRFEIKSEEKTPKDSMIYDGLFCSLIGEPMGITAENIAKKYKISRKEQDEYALHSHKKAIAARNAGKFEEEIIPVEIKNGKITTQFLTDEQPRDNTSLEALQKLSPVFKKDGTVTAGNASSLNDAAAMTLVASEEFVKQHNLKPMAKVITFASIGLDPNLMGLGAYYAAEKCLSKTKLKPSNIDLWEINEAFASQSIAVQRLLKIEPGKLNVNGGALALGHPIGASGARILTTLLHELKRTNKQYGVVSLCIGGGQGVAMLVENV